MTYDQAIKRQGYLIKIDPSASDKGKARHRTPGRLIEVINPHSARVQPQGHKHAIKVDLKDISCWHSRDAMAGIHDEDPMIETSQEEIRERVVDFAAQTAVAQINGQSLQPVHMVTAIATSTPPQKRESNAQATPKPPTCQLCELPTSSDSLNGDGLCSSCANIMHPAPAEPPANAGSPPRYYESWYVLDVSTMKLFAKVGKEFVRDPSDAATYQRAADAHRARTMIKGNPSLFVLEKTQLNQLAQSTPFNLGAQCDSTRHLEMPADDAKFDELMSFLKDTDSKLHQLKDALWAVNGAREKVIARLRRYRSIIDEAIGGST